MPTAASNARPVGKQSVGRLIPLASNMADSSLQLSRPDPKGETIMLLEKNCSSFRPLLVLILLTIVIGIPRTTRADVVTDWNQTAITSFKAANTRFVLQTRTLAMLHAAIFD